MHKFIIVGTLCLVKAKAENLQISRLLVALTAND